MYAQLGNIRFEGSKGFSSFTEGFGVNYAQHERIQGKPRLESVGDVLDTKSFSMYLHSAFSNPEQDIETLKKSMRDREILTLVLGTGVVAGNFVIPSMNVTTEFTDPNGGLISATIAVELLESFSEDPLKDAENKSKDNAFATSSKNSSVRVIQEPVLTFGMQNAVAVSEIQASGIQVQQYTAATEQNYASAGYYSEKINQALDKIQTNIDKIENGIPSSPQSLIPQALAGLYTSVQNIKGALPISNMMDFKVLVTGLSGSVSFLRKASTPNINQSIIRRT